MTPTRPLEEDFDDELECYECGGEGFVMNRCFDDTCCCADPETEHGFRPCSLCGQKGRAR